MEELLDENDILLLSQIHSLNTLECGLLKDDSFKYLAKLTNLETLIVTSDYYIENVSSHLLNIFRNCTKLEFMDLSYCDEEITRELIYKILDILKNVRNPFLQNPLRLRVADYPNYPQEQFNSMGEKYFIIEV
ncbi:uncharacterized protein LOC124460282 [Drosophila willistoni]|uniref:uncharacterized protein LOC124460282 n=1 Tax=Drosophila willistoni TaxID=7260 RepID=UPI001F0825F7|nr:uncharacterized protein LOC124460282 [Drosophila willistoni]